MNNVWVKTSRFLSEVEKCIKEDLTHTPANDLTIQAVYVLNALYVQDKQRPSDLAQIAAMAHTSFTPTLDRLEKAGLISRMINKSDRRSVLIRLTVKGKELQGAIESALANAEMRYGGG